MLFDLSGYSGNIRLHVFQSLKSDRPTAGNGWMGKLRSAPVEDPVPNPGPEVPSLGHPDSGTISHLPDCRSDSLGDLTSAGSGLTATDNELQLWVLASIAFAIFYANYMVAPLIPALSREFSVPPRQLGWLIPGYLIPYGLSTLVYGTWSDWWGRARTLVSLLFFAAATMILISFSDSSRTLLAARILSGVGCGGIVAIAISIVGDRYPYAVQGRPMGRMFGAIAAGIGLGSSLGPILNPIVGWRNEFRALAVVCCLGAVSVLRSSGSVISPNRRATSIRQVIREYLVVLDTPRGGRTLAFIFCNGAFHGGIFAWLGLLLARRYHLHDIGIGFALVGYGLPGIFFGATIGRWADHYGRRYVVPLGFLWAAGCAFLLVPRSTRFIAGLAITALSVGFDATHPLMSSITTSLNPKHRGQITGLATFANFVGMGVGAVCFQHLIRFGFGIALAFFASAQTLSGIAALYAFRRERPQMRSIPPVCDTQCDAQFVAPS
jgi:predicted MFS family arabinose efflux permease